MLVLLEGLLLFVFCSTPYPVGRLAMKSFSLGSAKKSKSNCYGGCLKLLEIYEPCVGSAPRGYSANPNGLSPSASSPKGFFSSTGRLLDCGTVATTAAGAVAFPAVLLIRISSNKSTESAFLVE